MYKEELPSECPPADALCLTKEAIRLIASETPTDEDFKSYAALGIPVKGDIPPCRWASCSLYDAQGKLSALPRVRDKKYLAYLDVTEQSGKCSQKNSHIDLWMYASFDPVGAVKRVVKRPDNG